MTQIIHHGNTIKRITCNKCNCVFSYSKHDIEYIYDRHNAYDSDLEYSYVECPECKNTVIIERYDH